MRSRASLTYKLSFSENATRSSAVSFCNRSSTECLKNILFISVCFSSTLSIASIFSSVIDSFAFCTATVMLFESAEEYKSSQTIITAVNAVKMDKLSMVRFNFCSPSL